MSRMAPQNVAIVGLGLAHKPHIAALRELPDRAWIAACYSPSPDRRAAFAVQHPDLPVVDSLDRILEDASIGTLILLTPPMTHLDLVSTCAAAGKHVLLEKPLDVDVARARRSVDTMEAVGRRLGVVLQHRFRTAALRLAELVRSGELGDQLSSSATIRWWRGPDYFAQPGRGMKARDGGGVLLTQAIHTLDLFLSLTGPVEALAAMAKTSGLRPIDTEDVVAAALRFRSGAVGTLDATSVAFPGFSEKIELACAMGTAIMEAESLAVHFKDGRTLTHDGGLSRSGGADPMAFSHEAHKALIADFLDAVAQDREPAISGREALKVQVLIEALLRAAAEGRLVGVA